MNTGYKLITYRDTNVYSETYGETMVERVEDFDMCPTVYDSQYWLVDADGVVFKSERPINYPGLHKSDVEETREELIYAWLDRHPDLKDCTYDFYFNPHTEFETSDFAIGLFTSDGYLRNVYVEKLIYVGTEFMSYSWAEKVVFGQLRSLNNRSISHTDYLKYVDLGEVITLINQGSLQYNRGLETLIVRNPTPPMLLGDFALYPDNFSIYVPDESVDDYKAATNWNKYVEHIKPLSELEEK